MWVFTVLEIKLQVFLTDMFILSTMASLLLHIYSLIRKHKKLF